MTPISIPAVYDGMNIHLLEDVAIHEPYRVMVTFIEPLPPLENTSPGFWGSFGGWQDERSPEAILQELYSARRSRSAPPGL